MVTDLAAACPGGAACAHYAFESWTGPGVLLLIVVAIILILSRKGA